MDAELQNTTKLALFFSVEQDAKYLSHRDTMTVWQRALARAEIPVLYSGGFNPHMRITLPLPRSVGMSAETELLVVYLAGPCCAEDAMLGLQNQLPEGIRVLNAMLISRSLPCQPSFSHYRLHLESQTDLASLRDRIDQFNACTEWPIHRQAQKKGGVRDLDLRQGITELKLNGNDLEYTVRIDPCGTVRIEEIRSAFDLTAPEQVESITRLHTDYPDFAAATDFPRQSKPDDLNSN